MPCLGPLTLTGFTQMTSFLLNCFLLLMVTFLVKSYTVCLVFFPPLKHSLIPFPFVRNLQCREEVKVRRSQRSPETVTRPPTPALTTSKWSTEGKECRFPNPYQSLALFFWAKSIKPLYPLSREDTGLLWPPFHSKATELFFQPHPRLSLSLTGAGVQRLGFSYKVKLLSRRYCLAHLLKHLWNSHFLRTLYSPI